MVIEKRKLQTRRSDGESRYLVLRQLENAGKTPGREKELGNVAHGVFCAGNALMRLALSR